MNVNRYHRQTLLPGVGIAGQERLAQSSVLLIGCGALGGVVAAQLVRAGVGTTRIVDRDIVELTGHAARSGLYTNLITSGIGVGEKLTGELAEAGLDHAQLSFQGADKETNDRLGHYSGSWERKRAFAGYVTTAGMPLTINAVIHRANLHQVGAFIELAVELGARRLEIAHTQYYGWALANRAALMPPRQEVE